MLPGVQASWPVTAKFAAGTSAVPSAMASAARCSPAQGRNSERLNSRIAAKVASMMSSTASVALWLAAAKATTPASPTRSQRANASVRKTAGWADPARL